MKTKMMMMTRSQRRQIRKKSNLERRIWDLIQRMTRKMANIDLILKELFMEIPKSLMIWMN